MAIDRYGRVRVIGNRYGTNLVHVVINKGVEAGVISAVERQLREGERLDTIAGREYGDSSLWWMIAAASGIRWGLQVPPGTLIRIPVMNDVLEYIR